MVAAQVYSCLVRCCRHRRRFAEARTVQQQPFPAESTASTPLRCCEVVQVASGGYESDYFDARSEVSDGEGEMGSTGFGEHGSEGRNSLSSFPSFGWRNSRSMERPPGNEKAQPLASTNTANMAETLLSQVRAIERRCRGSATPDADGELYPLTSQGSEVDSSVECLLR